MEISNTINGSNDFYKQISAPQKNIKQTQEQTKTQPKSPIKTDTVEIKDTLPAKEIEPSKKQKLTGKLDALIDKLTTSVKNSADLNDTVNVPRTIFKGYLSFMVGTTLITIASLFKKNIQKIESGKITETITKNGKIAKALNIIGLAAALFGTFSFVRPYIIKDKQKTEQPSEIKEPKTEEQINSESKPAESKEAKA